MFVATLMSLIHQTGDMLAMPVASYLHLAALKFLTAFLCAVAAERNWRRSRLVTVALSVLSLLLLFGTLYTTTKQAPPLSVYDLLLFIPIMLVAFRLSVIGSHKAAFPFLRGRQKQKAKRAH